MDCSPSDSSVHGILQARILEWVAMPSSRGSCQPRDWPRSPTLQADSLPSEPPGKPIGLQTRVSCIADSLSTELWGKPWNHPCMYTKGHRVKEFHCSIVCSSEKSETTQMSSIIDQVNPLQCASILEYRGAVRIVKQIYVPALWSVDIIVCYLAEVNHGEVSQYHPFCRKFYVYLSVIYEIAHDMYIYVYTHTHKYPPKFVWKDTQQNVNSNYSSLGKERKNFLEDGKVVSPSTVYTCI